jgi:hypothetical protein
MKLVRFGETSAFYDLRDQETLTFDNSRCDRKSSWYKSGDIERFKEESKSISKELRLLGKDWILRGIIPTSNEVVFESSHAQTILIQWTVKNGIGRGLERWICPTLALQRTRDRRNAILAVLHV